MQTSKKVLLFVDKKKQKNFIFFNVAPLVQPLHEAVHTFFWFFFFKKRTSYFFAVTLLLSPHLAAADSTTETELRAALQSATAQISSLEDQVANLQASQAPDVAMIEALHAQVQTLQASKGTTTPAKAASNAKQAAALAKLAKELSARNAELGKSQTKAQTEAAANAALKARLAATHAALNSCNLKNTQLYDLGMQILTAYAHKDNMLQAFANHEPFIGFKRVQLENIVQDDTDKFDQNQLNPATASP